MFYYAKMIWVFIRNTNPHPYIDLSSVSTLSWPGFVLNLEHIPGTLCVRRDYSTLCYHRALYTHTQTHTNTPRGS